MPFNFNAWISQVTTGHGFMVLAPTVLAAADGTVSWQTAIPLLVAGSIGLLWPENAPLKAAAQKAAVDVEALIAAYRAGLDHAAAGASTTSATAAGAVTTANRSAAVAALALAVTAGLGLAACTSQSAAQKTAASQAIASGLVCLANASGKVVATASTSDPNAVKAVNSAVAAGNVLTTDAACQTALASGAVALPNNATLTR